MLPDRKVLCPRRCLALVALQLALTAGCAPPSSDDALVERPLPIINGQPAAPGELPAVGALVSDMTGKYRAFCTGTLISPSMVLTAAHCLEFVPPWSPIGFFVGDDLGAPNAATKVVAIANRYPHPSYVGGQPGQLAEYYDIAVVILAQSVTSIAPAKLVRPAEVATLVRPRGGVLIAGFGMTRVGDTQSIGVKYLGVTTIGEVASAEIWIWGGAHPQKCNGDSGGPTFGDLDQGPGLDLRVIGVASRAGVDCTEGSAETRVDAYLSWIHQIGPLPCGSGLSADCEPPTQETGEDCTSDEQCVGTLCLLRDDERYCTQPCGLTQPPCPAPLVCDAADGVCIKPPPPPPPPPPPKALGDTCSSSSECASGLCATFASTSICTLRCDPSAANACPASMACLDTSADGDACGPCSSTLDPSSDPPRCAPHPRSGCAIGPPSDTRDSAPWMFVLALGLWRLLGLRRRRCHRGAFAKTTDRAKL